MTRPKRAPRHSCGGKPPPEVFFPSAYSRFHGALFLEAFHCHRALRPQGFAPPRRFAPRRTCRICFTPVPLLGFRPPRIPSCTGVVRPFGRLAPHDLSRDSFRPRAVSPGYSPARSRPPCKVIHPHCCASLPGLCLLRGFLPRTAAASRYVSRLTNRALRCDTPLMHFALTAFTLTVRLCSRVSPIRRAPNLSRDSGTSLKFSTSSAFSTLQLLASAGFLLT